MLRSPTVFEDVVKTVCTTNCAWSATVRMVNALVTNLGEPAIGGGRARSTHAFPTPAAMARGARGLLPRDVRAGLPGRLPDRARHRRSPSGELDLEALARAPPEELSDDELEAAAARAPRRRPLRRRAHHDDDGPQPPADPRLLDPPDVRAAARPHEAGPRRDDPAAVPPVRASTRDWRSGCSSPATGSTDEGCPAPERGAYCLGPCGPAPTETSDPMTVPLWRPRAVPRGWSRAPRGGCTGPGVPRSARSARAWSRSPSARPHRSSRG